MIMGERVGILCFQAFCYFFGVEVDELLWYVGTKNIQQLPFQPYRKSTYSQLSRKDSIVLAAMIQCTLELLGWKMELKSRDKKDQQIYSGQIITTNPPRSP